MSETYQIGLPFLQPSQAQKHVTVNEAMARLDGMVQLRLLSRSLATPPVSALEGSAYSVPIAAVNAWDGQDGNIAIFANGGWVFQSPQTGWSAFVVDESISARFDGVDWQADCLTLSPGSAVTRHRIVEIDHSIAAGPTSSTVNVIANGDQVIGVTGRVLTEISGTGLTGWQLGVSGSANRYGSGLSTSDNSWVRGLSGSPVTYWGDTPLLLTAEGGDFDGGDVRLSVHMISLVPPIAV